MLRYAIFIDFSWKSCCYAFYDKLICNAQPRAFSCLLLTLNVYGAPSCAENFISRSNKFPSDGLTLLRSEIYVVGIFFLFLRRFLISSRIHPGIARIQSSESFGGLIPRSKFKDRRNRK